MKKRSWIYCSILSLLLCGCQAGTPNDDLIQTMSTECESENMSSSLASGTVPTGDASTANGETKEEVPSMTDVEQDLVKHFPLGNVTSLGHSEINMATISCGQAEVYDLTDPNGWYAYGANVWGKEVITSLIDAMVPPVTGMYLDGKRLTEEDMEYLDLLRAKNSIPAEPPLYYGVTETMTDVRIYPTQKRYTVSNCTMAVPTDESTFDYFQESVLAPGEAVIIMNQSTDGLYYFVQASNTRGWIKKDDISLCSFETMCNWMNALDFVIVTERDLHVTTMEDEVLLPMGTRLLYFAETETSYYALVPCDADGTQDYVLRTRESFYELLEGKCYESGDLPVKRVLLEKDKCNAGYLYMNDVLVMEQAEKMLGMTYSWGGESDGSDCSGMINALFRCFGVIMPRNTSEMAMICGGNKNVVIDISYMTTAEKELYITSGQAGAILLMPGHVMLYAGEVDGVPSIIHNVISYKEVGEEMLILAGECCLTPLSILNGSDNPYLDSIQYVIYLD